MTASDLLALLPWLLLAALSMVLLLAVTFAASHRAVAALTVAGLAATVAAIASGLPAEPRQVTPLFMVDSHAALFTGLLALGAAAIVPLAFGYLEDIRSGRPPAVRYGNFYLLLVLGTLGGAVLAGADHFAALLLGFELLSVALFGLLAYPVERDGAVEAAAKYLVLAGVSSAFLFFGMALLFAEFGTLSFRGVGQAAAAAGAVAYYLAGFALIAVGVAFKLSLVPFHMWTPDVFEGAPAPVGAFISTVSKGAVAALLLRYLVESGAYTAPAITGTIAAAGFASMLAGNLLALLQNSLKRMLAYSSIAHLGYLMIAAVVGGRFGTEAALFYLAAYFPTMIGAFGVISTIAADGHEPDAMEAYRGLARSRPALAGMLAFMLLSLAGIPVTAGFIAKFYLFAAGIEGTQWWLVGALIAGSAMGLFYYLRWITALYASPAGTTDRLPVGRTAGYVTLGILALLVIALGVYPGPLAELLAAYL